MSSPLDRDSTWGFVPVIGPIVWASGYHWCPMQVPRSQCASGPFLLAIFDGVLQAAGLTMLAVGIIVGASGGDRADAADQPRFAVAPMFGPGGTGLAVTGRF